MQDSLKRILFINNQFRSQKQDIGDFSELTV